MLKEKEAKQVTEQNSDSVIAQMMLKDHESVVYCNDNASGLRAMKQAEGVYDTITKVFQLSKSENIPTYAAAHKIAEQRIAAIGKVKLSY